MSVLVASLAAFAITVVGILALRPVAVAVNLIDRPGGRKRHRGKVPLVGGLAMFIGIVFGLGAVESVRPFLGSMLAAFAMMAAIGLFDDRFGLSPWLRLPAQAVAAVLLTVGTGTEITSIGNVFGAGPVVLHGMTMHVVTVLCVITAINALNMLDGMDGLAGAVTVVAAGGLGIAAALAGEHGVAAVCAVLGAAVTAFLLFNVPTRGNRRVRCFMGDAGSTLLGLALAWVCIRSSQGAGPSVISPINALWLVAVPVFEFFCTFFRRVARGRSPLVADAEHFHHLLLRAGFSVRGAFLMFLAWMLGLALTGLALDRLRVPESWSLGGLLLAGALLFFSIRRADLLLCLFPGSARSSRAWPRAVISSEPKLVEPAVGPVTD